MKKRITSFLLSLLLLASVTQVYAFSDVSSDAGYASALDQLIADGVIADQPGQPFQPETPITRGEFLALMLRASGIAFEGGENWQTSVAVAAYDAGIFQESYATETLSRPLSRYEAAEFLWRATGSVQPSKDILLVGGIADQSSIPARYQTAVLQGYLSGLFSGSETDRRFSGDDIVNRREAVSLIVRLAHTERRVIPKTEEVPKPTPTPTPSSTSSAIPDANYPYLLSQFSTKTTNYPNRNFNINKAANAINGTVIQPGGQFSFYRVVGNPGRAEGYLQATAFAGSKSFPAYGGGLCQNASTLFNAALRANLRIDERHVHSQKVNYVQPGYDATIYYGSSSLDFKFTNTLSSPIKIFMTYNSSTRTLSCQIYASSQVYIPNIQLYTTGSGKSWTLYRKADGVVNYTTKSYYRGG